jgi:hypothetical protein
MLGFRKPEKNERCNIAKYETDAAMPPGDVLLSILAVG